MTLYALQNVGDAIEAAREFLFPVTLSRWLRLAVVVFFVGGVSFNAPVSGGSSTSPSGGGEFVPPESPSQLADVLSGDLLVLVGAVVGVVVLLGVLWGFLGALMEFVFVESLRRDAVHLRRYSKRYVGKGLRLFVFRTLVALLGLAAVLGVGAVALISVAGRSPSTWEPTQILTAVALTLPVALVVFALVGLVNGFTTAFVVPVMLAEDRAVMSGWRRFWPTLRGQWKQYAVYVLVAFVLAIAVGIIAAMVVGIGAVVLAIPLVIVGGIVYVLAGTTLSLPVIVVLAALALVFVIAVLALLAVVQVPLQTFMRLYSLLVLGDTNDEFDLVADLRTTVRE